MKGSVLALVLTAAAAAFLAAAVVDAAPKKGASGDTKKIEEIMKKAFKKGTLLDKIKRHDASKEELQQFADYAKALTTLKPPQGDLDGWKNRTKLLYENAQAVAKGDDSKFNALFESATCKDCHNVHKPD